MIWRNNKKKAGSTKKIEALKGEDEKLREQSAAKKTTKTSKKSE